MQKYSAKTNKNIKNKVLHFSVPEKDPSGMSWQSADAHKKHFAQDETNNGDETKACDCDAVLQCCSVAVPDFVNSVRDFAPL